MTLESAKVVSMYALVLTWKVQCSFEERQLSAECSETPHHSELPSLTLHVCTLDTGHKVTSKPFLPHSLAEDEWSLHNLLIVRQPGLDG